MSYNLELREGYYMITVCLNECDVYFDGLFRQENGRKLFMPVRYNVHGDSIKEYKESHDVYQAKFDELWGSFNPDKPNDFVFYDDGIKEAFHVVSRLEYKQCEVVDY